MKPHKASPVEKIEYKRLKVYVDPEDIFTLERYKTASGLFGVRLSTPWDSHYVMGAFNSEESAINHMKKVKGKLDKGYQIKFFGNDTLSIINQKIGLVGPDGIYSED